MENIYNNYRNIVERAVLAGVITEDSKEFYLSAVDDRNDSELSELESLVNKPEIGNSNLSLHENPYNLKLDTNEHNIIGEIPGTYELNADQCLQEDQSILSGDTIENYSIFDLKFLKENSLAQRSDSDATASDNCEKKWTIAGTIPKVTKKPRKNQIVDFKVPIYINMKKKKAFIKPCYIENKEKNKCEKPCTYNCKINDFKSVSSKRRARETKWSFNFLQTKESEKNDCKNQSANFKSKCLNYSDINRHKMYQPNVEKSEMEYQEVNKSVKQKPSYFSSKQKKLPTTSKLSEDYFLQNFDVDPHETVYCCRKHLGPITSSRHYEMALSQQQKPIAKLKHPIKTPNISLNEKDESNVKKVLPLNKEKRVAKDKLCKHICNCKIAEHVSSPKDHTENMSDNESSMLEVPLPKHTSESESNRLLNVNIICQFYPDVDKEKLQDTGCSEKEKELKHASKDEQIWDAQDTENSTCETGKIASNKTIQRFTKMFTNMKINRKLKKED